MRKSLIMLLSVFVAWQTWNMSFGYPQPPNGGLPIPQNGGLPNGYPQQQIGGAGGLPNQSQDMAQLNGELESLWSGQLMECDDGWFPPIEQCDACNDEGCAERHGFYKTWGQIQSGNCYYAYSDCALSIDLGFTTICLRTANYYCCYDSKFSKMLVQQAYEQLGNNFYNILPGVLGNGLSSGNVCEQLGINALKYLDFKKLNPQIREWLQSKMAGNLGQELDGNTILNEVQQGINHMYGNYQGDNGINMIEQLNNNNNNGNNSENGIINQLEQESQEMINGN